MQLSLGPAAPQRGIALHHLSDCSPTAMLANRARHSTLTIHPCVGPSPHYYTMRCSRLFSHITLPNISSNRHHSSIFSLSSIGTCSSTLHRSISLTCFSIGGSDIYPARYHSLSCRLRHDYSDLHPTATLHIKYALPQDGLRLDGCLGQNFI